MLSRTRITTVTLCALLASLATSPAQAQTREVTTIKPLLIEAIRLGRAEGQLVGEAAQFMAREFGSNAPILITVKRIRAHKKPGCARLEVDTRQANVLDRTPEGASNTVADKQLVYEISFCENGRVPEEGGGL